ncbi:MAG: PIN domain-containing protein [Anaerolineae bacterium]
MREMLVDTSALIAFFINSEKHHPAARRFVAQHPTARWLILNTVFDEFVTWTRMRVSIAASIQLGQVLRAEHPYYLPHWRR